MEPTQEWIDALTVNEVKIMNSVASAVGVQTRQVSAVISLINEGCTIPFIARYRKEKHGDLDEVQIRDCAHGFTSKKALEERRIEVIKGIFAQARLNEELLNNIERAETLTELEDIYAPYKRKKKTRGMLAQERGLEPLAELMLSASDKELEKAAQLYVVENTAQPELCVKSASEALQGAMDIQAERISQNPDYRRSVKSIYLRDGNWVVKGLGDEQKKAASVYQMYYEYVEPINALKPHRVMAINRGEREGELEVRLEVPEEAAVTALSQLVAPRNSYFKRAVEDALRRLLSPAVLREIRSEATESADKHGISVFSSNLVNLLMQAPIKGARVLGIDPGIRTGTKCAAMDDTGKFLGHFVIHQDRVEDSKRALLAAAKKWEVKLIAIGNGTGSQEVRELVSQLITESLPDCLFTMVDEDGASVYSASDIAREEFPELDLTIRGAISIGRRLQDPLAELVKIDPKSIGVGLYQHDVNQKALSDSLDEVVGSVVNRVGVNLNTASYALLKYVSGINTLSAKKIVKYRDENGRISNREDLKKIPGMGPKTFEQCAGFLKIPESDNILDNTWVHPENYALAEELFMDIKQGRDIPHQRRVELKEKHGVGDSTLDDIIAELKKPNRDPREDFPKPVLQKDILRFEDLREGVKIVGKVKNVVDFGAFIDLGIKESALLHVSEMSDRFVDDPMSVIKVGDVREFRVISLDEARRRIGLSLKTETSPRASEAHTRIVSVKAKTPKAETEKLGAGKPRREREDDGMSYNPFANLKRK